MLKVIFKYKDSIFGVIIVLFISLAMLGFGVDFFGGSSRDENYAIKVNDQVISDFEYNSTKENYVNSLKERFGDMYTQISSLINIDKQIREGLVNQALIVQFAKELGFTSGDRAVASRVLELFPANTPKESADNYATFLRRTGRTPSEFEGMLRNALINEDYQNILSDLIPVTRTEIEARARKDKEIFDVNYIEIDPKNYATKKEPTEEELSEYYNKVATDFEDKEKVSYQFVVFDPKDVEKDFESTIGVDENEIEVYYSDNISRFTEPERVLARVINFRVDDPNEEPNGDELKKDDAKKDDEAQKDEKTKLEDLKKKAEDALARIKNGEDFDVVKKEVVPFDKDEDLQDKLAEIERMEREKKEGVKDTKEATNEENKNTSRWYKRGDLDVDVEKEVFEKKEKKLYDLIKTEKGFSIIEVLEYVPEVVKELKDVRDQIKDEIIKGLAPAIAKDKADNLKVLIDEGKDTPSDLAWQEVELSEAGTSPVEFMGLTDKVLENPTQKALVSEFGDKIVLTKIKEYKESNIVPYENLGDKKEKLISMYKESITNDEVQQLLNQIIADLKDNNLEKVANGKNIKLEKYEGFSKTEQNKDLFNTSTIKEAVSELSKEGDYSQSSVKHEDKFYIFQIAKVRQDDNAKVDKKDIVEKINKTKEEQREQSIKNILNVLQTKSDIKFGAHINLN